MTSLKSSLVFEVHLLGCPSSFHQTSDRLCLPFYFFLEWFKDGKGWEYEALSQQYWAMPSIWR